MKERTVAAAMTPNTSIRHAVAYITPRTMSNTANLGSPSARTVRKPIRVALNAQESEGGELWAGRIRTRSVSVDILKRGYLGLTVLSDDALPGCDHEKHPQKVT